MSEAPAMAKSRRRKTGTARRFDIRYLRKELQSACQYAGEAGNMQDANRAECIRHQLSPRLRELALEVRDLLYQRLCADGQGRQCAFDLAALYSEMIKKIADLAAACAPAQKGKALGNNKICIVAIGGFGRNEMAPGSDIDLMFLLPEKQTGRDQHIIEFILYLLWDLGLRVGHSSRNVDEMVSLARADMTIATTIIDARFLWGSKDLFNLMRRRFRKKVVAENGVKFIEAKLQERELRHEKQGSSRYLVEPNVKEGKGALRDLHSLFWIAKFFYHTQSSADLVRLGVLSNKEYWRFERCANFLWATRCLMHFITGRAEERLSFDLQPVVAKTLGYRDHPGQSAVERFMKHYFLIAKEIGDLTRIFCAALEEKHVKSVRSLSKFWRHLVNPLSSARRSIRGTDFLVVNGRINYLRDDVLRRDPVNMLRLFALAEQHDLPLHPEATKITRRSLGLVDDDLRNNAQANRLFLSVLTSRKDPETLLRRMNEIGILGRFIPEFRRVVALMQFSLYHHYTVDEHLIRAVGVLAEIERGEAGLDHPLSTDIIKTLINRRALFVAVFLHDIAKGRGEDHSIAGARLALPLCQRLGLEPAETELVCWLIEQHLQMSRIAQTRDLADMRLIGEFARQVQSQERLKLLLILTVADIRAVGPGTFNGWKGQLLRTLYHETEFQLTGGRGQLSPGYRVQEAKDRLDARLKDWPSDLRQIFLQRHGDAYWLRTDTSQQAEHAELFADFDRQQLNFAASIKDHPNKHVIELTMIAAGHPGLLSLAAGACARHGANIVDAQIGTTCDGLSLNSIFVTRNLTDQITERARANRIISTVRSVLEGRFPLSEALVSKATKPRKRDNFQVAVDISLNNASSDDYTVLEVVARNRTGLLYDLTCAITRLKLVIASAHIATYGERAVDTFYVTEHSGQKIGNIGRQKKIQAALFEAVGTAGQMEDHLLPAPAASLLN